METAETILTIDRPITFAGLNFFRKKQTDRPEEELEEAMDELLGDDYEEYMKT